MLNIEEFDGDGVDQEELDDSDVVYEINTYGADFDVEGLVKRIEREDIFRPSFQRQYVWTLPQASKFIESILLGLPVPSVFLYKQEDTNRLLIVDGLQRLTTLHAFVKGIFPTNERKFRLNKLKSKFDKLTYDELGDGDRRRLDDTIIHAFIIQQMIPSKNQSAVYHIFDRLNSNGTPLHPQEMRAAIFHGSYLDLIDSLNKLQIWRSIFGPEHKRSKDHELILRFFALYYCGDNYRSPVNTFLNEHLSENRDLEKFPENDLQTLFKNTMERIHGAIGERPFRLTRALNVAFFDSFSVAVAKNPDVSEEKISSAYKNLLTNQEYIDAISDTTSSPSNVQIRLQIATDALL